MTNPVRPLAALALLAVSSPALADTVTTEADTLVVVTPNAPVIVNSAAPGAQAQMAPIPVAPPVQAPVVAAAPQNEPWENVSHINGQVVEVGERGKYLKKTFKTNISSNPVGWMLGFYGVSVAHAVHPNVAIRGDVNLFRDVFGEGMNGHELGATMPIYFKRVFSGPFLEPGIMIRHTEETYDDYYYDASGGGSYDTYTEGDTLVGPQIMFGWHSTFDSGLNIAAAFGFAKNLGSRMEDEYGYSSEPDIEPTGYFRVGYAWK